MSTPALSYEKVREHLEALSMGAALAALDGVLEQEQEQQRTPGSRSWTICFPWREQRASSGASRST